jgi:hypothetical protein
MCHSRSQEEVEHQIAIDYLLEYYPSSSLDY